MPLAFEQQPKESSKVYAAFALYLSLGPERSTRTVGRQLGKSEGLIERWAAKFDWRSRVAAHGAHLAVVEREATEALVRGKSAEWLTRREEHRDDEWSDRTQLMKAARSVLKRFTEDGKGATLGDVARALDVASKLGRLATGMATDKTEVTGEDGGPILVDLEVAIRKVYGPKDVEPEAVVVDVEAVPGLPSPDTSCHPLPSAGRGKMPATPPAQLKEKLP